MPMGELLLTRYVSIHALLQLFTPHLSTVKNKKTSILR
jgi:hypothetical protein